MRLADTLTLLTLTILLLIRAPLFTSTTDYEPHFDDVLKKEILFNEESKILLAEKFIPVQFLVPFPSFNFTLKSDFKTLLQELNELWKEPSVHCSLDFSSHF